MDWYRGELAFGYRIAFALHLEAINEFSRLQHQLGPLPIGARGALIWWSTEEATASFIAEQQA